MIFPSKCLAAGLLDGSLSYQKFQFWYILEGLRMKNIYLLTFGIVYGLL
jgi:hypothetical protein